MPIKVDFYLLTAASLADSRLFICRLLAKIYKQKQYKVYVYVDSAANAQLLYDSLWTFNDISFVPHQLYSEHAQMTAPIIIGTELPKGEYDILVNLTAEVLADCAGLSRILEIIPNDEELKTAGRKKYKDCLEKDHTLATHKIEQC